MNTLSSVSDGIVVLNEFNLSKQCSSDQYGDYSARQ